MCQGHDTLVLTLPGMQEESSSSRSRRGLLPTRRPHRPRRPEGHPRQGRQAPSPRTWRRRRRTWAPAALPRRQMLAGRGLPFPSRVLVQVSRLPFVPASPIFLGLLVLALHHPFLRRPDSSSVKPEDVDVIIEGVSKAAEADAEKTPPRRPPRTLPMTPPRGLPGRPTRLPLRRPARGLLGKPAGPLPRRRRRLVTSLPP